MGTGLLTVAALVFAIIAIRLSPRRLHTLFYIIGATLICGLIGAVIGFSLSSPKGAGALAGFAMQIGDKYPVYPMDCIQSGIIYAMKDDERIRRLIPLWLKRPENQRTEKDLVIFYRWLEENHPELLKRHNDDEFRQLKADLQDYIREA